MKKYLSFFRLRFITGLQYRTAALAGIATQFFWGAMEILTFRAFYQSDPASFPMTLQATSSYIWIQQAFLVLLWAGIWKRNYLMPYGTAIFLMSCAGLWVSIICGLREAWLTASPVQGCAAFPYCWQRHSFRLPTALPHRRICRPFCCFCSLCSWDYLTWQLSACSYICFPFLPLLLTASVLWRCL